MGIFSYSYSVGSHPKSTLRDALHVLPYPQPQTDGYFRSTLFLLCHFMPLQHPAPLLHSASLVLFAYLCGITSQFLSVHIVCKVSLGRPVALQVWSLR